MPEKPNFLPTPSPQEIAKILSMQTEEVAATVLPPLERLWKFQIPRPFFKQMQLSVINDYRRELLARKLQLPRLSVVGMSDTAKYIYFYHYANAHTLDENERLLLENNAAYRKKMSVDIAKQFILAEHIDIPAPQIVTEYSPLVSRYKMYCNFLLRTTARLPESSVRSKTCKYLIKKALMQVKCVFSTLAQGFETDAITIWRSLYELECVLDILTTHDEATAVEFSEFDRCSAIGDAWDGEETAEAEWLKQKMEQRNIDEHLRTPFMRFGWLMILPEYQGNAKLNFKNGLQLLAGNTDRYPSYKTACLISHPTAITATFTKDYLCRFASVETNRCLTRITDGLLLLLKQECNLLNSDPFYSENAIYLSLINESLEQLPKL